MYITASFTIVLGILFCSVYAVHDQQYNNGAFGPFAQGPSYQGTFSSPTYGGVQSMTYNGGASMAYNGGASMAYNGGASMAYNGAPSMAYNGAPSMTYNGPPSVAYSGVQNVDYTLQGQYQAQVQGGHYVTSQSYPNYNQPGLPWHARQETPSTQHVVHHHVHQSPMGPQPQYGPMPMHTAPVVHPPPMGPMGVSVPVVGGHYPAPVYQPDLLTHVVNHPAGRVAATAGLAALFYKAIKN